MRKKAVLIGKGYWGSILQNYIYKDYQLIAIFGKDYRENDLIQALQEADVAFIATPLKAHFSLCKIALECDCVVFVEKPTTPTLSVFESLLSIAQHTKHIIFTDYIYTFSRSIRYALDFLASNRGHLQSIHATLTQYGAFYEDESVIEVLGVHYLSILAQMCQKGILEYLLPTRSIFCDKDKQSVCIDIESSHKGSPIHIRLDCSLLHNTKARIIQFHTDECQLQVDMLSPVPFSVSPLLTNVNLPVFDEKNNLSLSLQYFHQALNDRAFYTSHLQLCKQVLELMDRSNLIATFQGS